MWFHLIKTIGHFVGINGSKSIDYALSDDLSSFNNSPNFNEYLNQSVILKAENCCVTY